MPCKLETLFDRFVRKIQLDFDTGCWNWIGCVNKDGYGQIGLGYEIIGAHRIAWFLFVSNHTDGLELDHICRNRRCVNPAHLREGTHQSNCNNRNARTHCPNGHPYKEVGYRTRVDANGFLVRNCNLCVHYQRQKANEKRRLARQKHPASPIPTV